jgi:hypothetical protein
MAAPSIASEIGPGCAPATGSRTASTSCTTYAMPTSADATAMCRQNRRVAVGSVFERHTRQQLTAGRIADSGDGSQSRMIGPRRPATRFTANQVAATNAISVAPHRAGLTWPTARRIARRPAAGSPWSIPPPRSR